VDETDRRCTEWGGGLRPIKLVVHGQNRIRFPLAEYAEPDARRAFFIYRYDTNGQVVADACETCGRIALYAAPYLENP
jgi:hypothetical protein